MEACGGSSNVFTVMSVPTPERSSPSPAQTAPASRSSSPTRPGAASHAWSRSSRSRAAIEDSIRCAKASGLRNLPFRAYAHHAAWRELVLLGCDLVAFVKTLLLEGELAMCEPKRLRYRLLHVAGRIVSHTRYLALCLPRGWPWVDGLIGGVHPATSAAGRIAPGSTASTPAERKKGRGASLPAGSARERSEPHGLTRQ
ncbi:MAG: transposase [Thermoleophilia bacterium]